MGGLAAAFAGRVPIRGEVVASPDRAFEFDIVDADPRRVKRLRLRLIGADRPEAPAAKSPPPEFSTPTLCLGKARRPRGKKFAFVKTAA